MGSGRLICTKGYCKEDMMEPRKLLDTLAVADRLKDTTRHCYTAGGRHESVAEHSWRAALMAYFLRDEFPEADMDKVIRMLLIHDLGEAFTGDIPSFRKTAANEAAEDTLLKEYVRDKNAGLNPDVPCNYFPDDDDTKEPVVTWRSCANLLYSNWLNYFVYQTTQYDITQINSESFEDIIDGEINRKVVKFGGTSLASASQFRKCAE